MSLNDIMTMLKAAQWVLDQGGHFAIHSVAGVVILLLYREFRAKEKAHDDRTKELLEFKDTSNKTLLELQKEQNKTLLELSVSVASLKGRNGQRGSENGGSH